MRNRENDPILPPDEDPWEAIGYGPANPETTARIRAYLDETLRPVVATSASVELSDDSITAGFTEQSVRDGRHRIVGKQITRPDGEHVIVFETEHGYAAREFEAVTELINRPPRPEPSN
ncbi:MAG: hypothetical protein WDN66_05745 [Candidatus Saccharibacteria bacterium]